MPPLNCCSDCLRPKSANRGVIAGEMHLAPQKYANVCKFVLVFATHAQLCNNCTNIYWVYFTSCRSIHILIARYNNAIKRADFNKNTHKVQLNICKHLWIKVNFTLDEKIVADSWMQIRIQKDSDDDKASSFFPTPLLYCFLRFCYTFCCAWKTIELHAFFSRCVCTIYIYSIH